MICVYMDYIYNITQLHIIAYIVYNAKREHEMILPYIMSYHNNNNITYHIILYDIG